MQSFDPSAGSAPAPHQLHIIVPTRPLLLYAGKESLLTLLTTGSEVEFELGPSQQDPRKMVGVWVKTVPRGTSRGLAVLQDGLSGIVVRELSGQQRRPQVSPWSLQYAGGVSGEHKSLQGLIEVVIGRAAIRVCPISCGLQGGTSRRTGCAWQMCVRRAAQESCVILYTSRCASLNGVGPPLLGA